MTHMELTRRSFVVTTAAAAGGLMLGVGVTQARVASQPWLSPTEKEGTEISHWVSIDPDGVVTLRTGNCEMGQGAFTAVPMLINEELHADWNMIRTQYADANRHLRNDGLYGRMSTGGSATVRRGRVMLQQAGASVRERLKAAAAQAWGVDASTVAAKDSVLSSGNRSGTYAEFATQAASIQLPEEPAIKTPDQFQLLGTSIRRVDVPLKVNGSAQFGIDTRLPGMLYAAVNANPVPWGGPPTFDFDAIADRPGVVAAVELSAIDEHNDYSIQGFERRRGRDAMQNAVVVVADSWYRAKTALELMPVEWEYGPWGNMSQDGLQAHLNMALEVPGEVKREEGADTLGIISRSSNVLTADFFRPYEPHVRMEPVNSTVSVTANRVDIYTGTQNAPSTLGIVADQLGVDPAIVYMHQAFLGGGFGGGPGTFTARQAAEVSRQVGAPVKLVWAREEDIMNARHRPAGVGRITAALGDDGLPVAVFSRNTAHRRSFSEMPYHIPNQLHELTETGTHVPTTSHRAPGTNVNSFMSEQFVDEMALAAGWDPLEWRIHLTEGVDDWNNLFRTLKTASGFTTDLPKGEGMGVAGQFDHGTIIAESVHLTVSRRGQLRIEKVHVVADSGHLINPLTGATQMEGGVGFEISHSLFGGLEMLNGQFVNNNFDTFHMARIADMPEVQVTWALTGGEKWGGLGEPPCAPFAPALANAIFFATGKRLRSTPITQHDLSWS